MFYSYCCKLLNRAIMEQFRDLHYFHLPSQGNIYTMTSLEVANGPQKILVASLKREIFCVEFQESSTGLIPTAKEVSFTYIPSGAEIISIDAFNRSSKKNDFVIGITIIKNSSNLDSLEFYLNIYSEWEESEDFSIESLAQNCLNVELSFTPYQLTHTDLVIWDTDRDEISSKEVVFLLSGNDNQIHVYREYTTDHLYKELENKDYFPEFAKIPSPVVWTDIYISKDYSEHISLQNLNPLAKYENPTSNCSKVICEKLPGIAPLQGAVPHKGCTFGYGRISALVCECGYVRVTKVCIKTNQLVLNFSTKFDNYISHVSIYPEFDEPDDALVGLLEIENSSDHPKKKIAVNVMVVNTMLPPVLFEDVLTYGLSKYSSFPRHDFTCVFTCCKVADVDFDGEKEILVGNSAEELILYKKDKEKGWWPKESKLFAAPLLKLTYVDVMGDGVNELVVLSSKGVHFMQHDFSFVQKVLKDKMADLSLGDVASIKLS